MFEYVNLVYEKIVEKDPRQSEFHKAVKEVFESFVPTLERHKIFKKEKFLARSIEPERIVIFRVPWLNDNNEIQVNRGFRVQFNSALGSTKAANVGDVATSGLEMS